jgi:CRP-like cAMP-binding protein
METIALLADIPLFSHLQRADLERVAGMAQRLRFEKGEVILREDSRDNRLFVVLEGKVGVVKDLGDKKEKHLYTFGPYAHIGEMALIDESRRSASVVAETDTVVLSIDNWDLKQEIHRNPDLALELLKNLSWRLRAMNKIVRNTLGTMAPICAKCHKILEPSNKWVTLQQYVQDHSEIEVSHSICPDCSIKHYPHFYDIA